MYISFYFNLISRKKKHAENVDNRFLDNKCVNYFYDLNEDYPTNCYGSWGYVAIASLLRYYVFIYNDSIIENKYKENNGLKHVDKEKVKKLN